MMIARHRRRQIRSRAFLAALVAFLVPARALAQGGWTTEKHPDLGMTFPRAKDYEQIPTQPDEHYRVLYFAEKVVEKAKEHRKTLPGQEEWLPPRLKKRGTETGL
jgi:hypothetical protein